MELFALGSFTRIMDLSWEPHEAICQSDIERHHKHENHEAAPRFIEKMVQEYEARPGYAPYWRAFGIATPYKRQRDENIEAEYELEESYMKGVPRTCNNGTPRTAGSRRYVAYMVSYEGNSRALVIVEYDGNEAVLLYVAHMLAEYADDGLRRGWLTPFHETLDTARAQLRLWEEPLGKLRRRCHFTAGSVHACATAWL